MKSRRSWDTVIAKRVASTWSNSGRRCLEEDATNQSTAATIFVSHTTRDRRDLSLAHRLAESLEKRGAKVWIAPESIPVGTEWQPHLVSAILAKSTHFLVILSRASIEAEWVIEEIRLARERYERDRSFRVLSIVTGKLGDFEGSDFIGRMQALPYEDEFSAQLEHLASALGLAPAGPSSVDLYLEAVRDYCAGFPYVDLRELRSRKSLGEIYVPLKVRPNVAEMIQQGGVSAAVELSISEVLKARNPPHVLMLGEPGSGKSTLLRRLAERCFHDPESIGLDRRYLPLLVPMRRLAAIEGSLEERLHAALGAELALSKSLPRGFFEDWQLAAGAPWLILLDAADEISATERDALLQWIAGVVKFVGESRVVMSSRISGHKASDVDPEQFTTYTLLPFSPDQAQKLAANWFGDDAKLFLNEIDRLRAGELGSTALLLTIAAQVYLKTGSLPGSRARLYRSCVDIWLDQAERAGLDRELGEPLAGPRDLQIARLARLALRMTEERGADSSDQLGQIMAEYLRDDERFSQVHARAYGRRFVDVMARRSGVLVERGGICEMVHPSFREYLAAVGFADLHLPDSTAAQNLPDDWDAVRWFEVVLFLIGVWSDRREDVSLFLEPKVEKELGLLVAGEALADGAPVGQDLERRIVGGLLAAARKDWFVGSERFHPLKVLGRLADRPAVKADLLDLARDGSVPERIRFQATAELVKRQTSEAPEVLAEIVNSKPEGFWQTDQAGYLLREAADAGVLAALAANPSVNAEVRMAAAVKDIEWSWPKRFAPDVVSTILELSVNPAVDPGERKEALQLIKEIRPAEALLPGIRSILADSKTRMSTRLLTARMLIESGCQEEGESALLAIANDRFVPPGLRRHAAVDVVQYQPDEPTTDDAVRLLGYACDYQQEWTLRVVGSDRAFETLQINANDVGVLLEIARDTKQVAAVRGGAVFRLGLQSSNPQAREAAEGLEALARDCDSDTAGIALEALLLIGQAEQSLSSLLECLRKRDMEPLAAIVEHVVPALGPDGAIRLFLALSRLMSGDELGDAFLKDPEDELRRVSSLKTFKVLFQPTAHEEAELLLVLASQFILLPAVRNMARALAFRAIAAGKPTTDLLSMVRDPATDSRARDVIAWRLQMLPVEEVAGTLGAVATDSEAPGRVRLTALEGLVKLGKGDDATDILVTAGGGTPAPRNNRSWDEVVNQAQHRALSEWAWRVGAGDLSPILVDVASVLGVREAADLLSRFSEV